ncbi:Transcription regulator, AsnC-type-like protein [Gordonia bronchialis DSM 43247]|uniref:Transcription regulator, AsnC-type-like protein n=1 Tax=Gordonia bronchialis (strain ATCC 25592 / DSM 43247 / BCRC 13721 / JCM 3198 / KCTC 3076 / NBRC 16047 / NCTC 10667) TaxID=526226 RepID=D0LBK5_GORB4|nr:Lrp/AsnC family transcriptional regulator [Gordonia bronchialis]ACY21419.1 Transcription regulator, AsnC-type-like protein [Gordonia bronchialis DSM 43247]MCC3324202.1 Lrp/AsnC family transcriptional regulator [Gordonia bronchialis]QGS24917.1 winged helix-turn-helix transcriptional regulator [Gordonia bronchialis]UAK38808.1 Lrp/AsnC family transcriptional regulator [Gordonia bronchialis]STQ64300.1 Leucine-responsive regulatory protein [Gordonia bronchialis]
MPKDIRPVELDTTDRELLRLLQGDARMTNNELAQRVGIAPSTCHGRVRRLIDTGVIRGFFADVDPAAVGRPLRAMVAVSLQSDARGQIRRFVGEIAAHDEVIDVFFLAGTDDYLLHVATADTETLRQFVEMLNGRREVAGTTTSLVFDHRRGGAPIF